jgi:hypothetical protein
VKQALKTRRGVCANGATGRDAHTCPWETPTLNINPSSLKGLASNGSVPEEKAEAESGFSHGPTPWNPCLSGPYPQ